MQVVDESTLELAGIATPEFSATDLTQLTAKLQGRTCPCIAKEGAAKVFHCFDCNVDLCITCGWARHVARQHNTETEPDYIEYRRLETRFKFRAKVVTKPLGPFCVVASRPKNRAGFDIKKRALLLELGLGYCRGCNAWRESFAHKCPTCGGPMMRGKRKEMAT